MQNIDIIKLKSYGDTRGPLYNIPGSELQFIDKIQNIHFGKIHPNSIRGNHYHRGREMLIISYSNTWTLAWTTKDSAEISKEEFTGSGAVLIKVKEGIVHSIKNNGQKDLEIIAFSQKTFPKEDPDTFTRILLT